METSEIKNLEYLTKLAGRYLNTLNPSTGKKGNHTVQIKVANYCELGCFITETIKLCIVALDQEAHKISTTNKTSPINVALVLEMVLEMFPTDEFEFLSEISNMLITDSNFIAK
ncbi:hypothetical protein [Flavobacterium chilense]|uniref:Uncharacterized protein n=1 Tax=Flavobacterium chilense TaxID=946677 RepID=A0A1M7JEQ7_9FLAO|nr:hypothetical protein [Flavobacterium chilense]SHM51465.1 hypothetical protein SAMN05444484_106291 [Flavobacterium chilense]